MAKKPRTSEAQSTPPVSDSTSGADGGLRVATYHRCSTADQDPQLARDALTDWTKRQGGRVVLAEEESASGMWNQRPGLQRVLEAARRGQIDCVVVWALDRFGRSALDVLTNVQALADARVRFAVVSQPIDMSPRGDPMGQLMLTILGAVAQFERALIVERTKLGIAKAKRMGKHCGRPRLRLSTEKVVELKAAGKTWKEIARELKCTVGVARLRYREATGSQPART
jgi:putative DNA-invertase from lambdoid prophage Rac